MKKWWIWICCACLLTGCGAAETFETVGDDILQPVMAPAGQIVLELAGAQREGLTTAQLLELFRQNARSSLETDRMLLSAD